MHERHLETLEFFKILGLPFRPLGILFEKMPDLAAAAVARLTATWPRRFTVIVTFILVTIVGTKILLPPLDYQDNANTVMRRICFSIRIRSA